MVIILDTVDEISAEDMWLNAWGQCPHGVFFKQKSADSSVVVWTQTNQDQDLTKARVCHDLDKIKTLNGWERVQTKTIKQFSSDSEGATEI